MRKNLGAALAHPIQDVFSLLRVSHTSGYELTKPGPNGEPPQIQTFLIGRRRFATDESVRAFLRARIEEAQKESAAARKARVEKAVAGRAQQRARERAEKTAS